MVRIEKNGIGPFNHPETKEYVSQNFSCTNINSHNFLPSPDNDYILSQVMPFIHNLNVVFCFNDNKIMNYYIHHHELNYLKEKGFNVVNYNHDEYFFVIKGDGQSILFLNEEEYEKYQKNIQKMISSGYIP